MSLAGKKQRGNGEGTEYQEASGRWVAQVYVTTPEGLRRRKTFRGKTKQEVRKEARAAQRAAELGQTTPTRRPPTVTEFGTTWLTGTLNNRVQLGDLKPATWANYRNLWMVHVEPGLGGLRLDRVTAQVVERWLASKMTSKSASGKTPSPRTVQAIFAVLRKAMNDAVRDGLLPGHQLDRVAQPRVTRREPTHLSKEDAKRLREFIKGHEYEALWTLLLGCGLRVGEALALRWSDLDLDKGRLTVRQAVADLPGDMTTTKSVGRRRGISSTKTPASVATVPVPALVVESLRKQRIRAGQQRLAAVVWQDHDLVFPSPVGTHIDHARVGTSWRALRIRAALPDLRIHDLRHSAATFLLASGVDIKVVQSILRHSRLATTADLYAHVLDEVSDAAAVSLDAYLRDAGWGT